MTNNEQVLVSGAKPTGRLHIGNYFGALRQWVELQDKYKSYIFIPNYHALTTIQNGKELEQLTLDVAIDLLAIGIDPEKVILFKQSDVPEVTELAWIFNCLTTMPYLMRAHAFKDAEAKNKDINVGTFDYPILMAADILIYDADIVPVGQDQKQHVEMARDIAEKFNRVFNTDVFKLPKEYIQKEVAVISGIDGQKMSKSYDNIISLFAEDSEIKNQVMKIITNSKNTNEVKNPEDCNIFALHKFFSQNELFSLKKRYIEGGIGYKESKEILLKNIISFIKPLREKRKKFAKNPKQVLKILEEGGKKARIKAQKKMKQIHSIIGL